MDCFKKIRLNPALKPLRSDETCAPEEMELVLRDGTSEHDVRSSECVSIEFDHLEKASNWSEVSMSDFQIAEDSGGPYFNGDPWIIKLKRVSNTSWKDPLTFEIGSKLRAEYKYENMY